MDPKTQMPDIKAEVLKTDDGKKKGAGFLGLFGGGGSGAAGGLGGLGAGAAGGGGLLATKAGMLALVLMGSAVAGGIGLAGYKMFGPGDADRTGGNLSLFAPKPQQSASDGVAPVSADGTSASLSMMAQGAAKDKEPEVSDSASAAAPTDAAAGDPAKDAAAADAARREAAARAANGGALNSGGGAGAVGSMGRGLMNTKKLGALSGSSSGGASTTAGSGTVGKLGEGLAAGSRNGSSSGFSRGGPGAKASGAKGRAARGGRGARAQARNVMGDQAGGRAGSSFAAGRTYDGSATQSGGAIGPDGGAIGMDGADTGTGAQPKSIAANSAPNVHEQEPPPATPNPIVTPWEKALNNALMAVALAGALMMAASMLLKDPDPITKGWTVMLAKVLLGLAVAASAVALYFAGQATFGPGGQKTQGALIMLAATCAGGLSAYMLSQIWSIDTSADVKAEALADVNSNPMLIKVIGGAGAVALIGSMMMPKKSMPKSEAEANGYPTSYHAPAPQQNYRV